MTLIVTRFPISDADDPAVWRVVDGEWHGGGQLSGFVSIDNDAKIMAVVAASDARCNWSSFPELEPKQAEGVARIRVAEHSLGEVHIAARYVTDNIVVTAAIAPTVMEYGLSRLTLRGLNPDIVIPVGLVIAEPSEHILRAEFDGSSVLRGPQFAIPDEPVLRDLIIQNRTPQTIDQPEMRNLLVTASEHPALNLREGIFAKREPREWGTANQRKWAIRLGVALIVATILLGLVTWSKHKSATAAENERALVAAQKIDPSILDIEQAEAQLDRALAQKGTARGRFAPLTAGLWRAVKSAPNVSVRELRYGTDGLLSVVLAAPDANSINNALIGIQQDGYRVTATPRQDNSGATLVDLTMRMP
jgi:general secretion pathway protein L